MIRKRKEVDIQAIEKRNAFFEEIWKERPHVCTNCAVNLGREPKTYMFDHVLEKSKFPHLSFEKCNISVLCLNCHDKKTRGFKSSTMLDNEKKVREKFGI